jgi:hypothetical protein
MQRPARRTNHYVRGRRDIEHVSFSAEIHYGDPQITDISGECRFEFAEATLRSAASVDLGRRVLEQQASDVSTSVPSRTNDRHSHASRSFPSTMLSSL